MVNTKLLFISALIMLNFALFGQTSDDTDSVDVFTIVEEMPYFPECNGEPTSKDRQDCTQEKLFQFLAENLQYPEDARDNDIQGVVYVNFVINEQGRVVDANVIRGVSESLDQEALRVVNLLPLWHPGTQKGKAVRVSYNIPLRFSITENTKKKKKKRKKG